MTAARQSLPGEPGSGSSPLILSGDSQPFDGLFSRTTRVSQHQKGRTILDFNEARDDRVAVTSAGPHYDNRLHTAALHKQLKRHLVTHLYSLNALPDAQLTRNMHSPVDMQHW